MSNTSLEKQQPTPEDAASEDGLTTAVRLDKLEERSRSNQNKAPSSLTEEEARQRTLVDLIERKEWKHVLKKLEGDAAAESSPESPEPAEASVKQILTLEGRDTRGYPLHLALSKKPPVHLVQSLIEAYPDAVKAPEDKWGRLPLHVACIFTASAQILQLLLSAHKEGLHTPDQAEGRLPVHYACLHSSPFEIAVLVDAEPRALVYQDFHQKTPLDLAQESSNPHREAIVERLEGKTHLISEKLRLRRRETDAQLILRDASAEIVGDKQKLKHSSQRKAEAVFSTNKTRTRTRSSSSTNLSSTIGLSQSDRGSRRSMSNPRERVTMEKAAEKMSSSASLDGAMDSRSTATSVTDWTTDFEKSISLSAAFLVKSADTASSSRSLNNKNNNNSTNSLNKSFQTPAASNVTPSLDPNARRAGITGSDDGTTASRRSLTITDLSSLVVQSDQGSSDSFFLDSNHGTNGTKKSKKKRSGKKGKKEKKERKERKSASASPKLASSSSTSLSGLSASNYTSQKQQAQALTKGLPPTAAATGTITTTANVTSTKRPNKGKVKKPRRSLTTDDLQRFDRQQTPRLNNGTRRSKPRGLGSYLEENKQVQEQQEARKASADSDLKSMGALSLPTNLFSQPLLEEAFEESESNLDNEDGFIFSESLQMMLASSTATGAAAANAAVGPGPETSPADADRQMDLIKLEAQIRNLDVRKEALTQETTNIENTVRRKRTEAQKARERIASLQAKLLEAQVKLEKEKRSLELTMMNIQLQEETLTDHRSKMESVDTELKQFVEKRERKLGEHDDVRSRKQ